MLSVKPYAVSEFSVDGDTTVISEMSQSNKDAEKAEPKNDILSRKVALLDVEPYEQS